MVFYKDWQWYTALLLAPLFWAGYALFIQPLEFKNILEPLTFFLFSIFLYPIVEEVVFRGGLQGYLRRYLTLKITFCQFSFANILTSCVFSLFHLINQDPFWALLTFFPSLIFGYFRDRHHRVLPCIILHSVYNLVFFSLVL